VIRDQAETEYVKKSNRAKVGLRESDDLVDGKLVMGSGEVRSMYQRCTEITFPYTNSDEISFHVLLVPSISYQGRESNTRECLTCLIDAQVQGG
jgi:tRNA(His) 5'-end guanylyltransferase